MSEQRESELLFKVHRIKNKDGEWMPAIEDVTTHDITPLWVAGTVYLIIDRYLSCIDDSKQQDFHQETLFWLARMLKDHEGSGYIHRINKKEIE
jgi:hypothetical protein